MAGAAIQVEIDDREVTQALAELISRGQHLEPVLNNIGEALINSTQARFETETDPEGRRWPQNADSTLIKYLRRRGGLTKKRTLTQKGAKALGAKKILRDSGYLADFLRPQVDGDTLLVGTDRKYGAMQQFGGTKAQWPHLWGDIPARPFLGLSTSDRAEVLDILSDYLSRPFR